MKKLLIAIAALTTVAATPAFAETTKDFDVTASVGSVCGAFRDGENDISVPFSDLALTPTTSVITANGTGVGYRCNSPGGFIRTITSANKGKLVRAGASAADALNSIPFKMNHGGGSSLSFSEVSLSVDKVDTFPGAPAFLTGQTGTVTFSIPGVAVSSGNNYGAPGTSVFAGTYADTVTISITAN